MSNHICLREPEVKLFNSTGTVDVWRPVRKRNQYLDIIKVHRLSIERSEKP